MAKLEAAKPPRPEPPKTPRSPFPPGWEPLPKQRLFLESDAHEVLYGGAAGGGKSESLLIGPLAFVHHPAFKALLLRRTFPDLQKSLISRSKLYYTKFGARYHEGNKVWTFPSGAEVHFGYLKRDDDVQQYQSFECQYIGFDELTHFSEYQFRYMQSRARSSSSLPIRIRAATNPGGPGHDWVFARWGPWLDPECLTQAAPGETLRYDNTEDGEQYVNDGKLSRVFIPATVADNPYIAVNDPNYVEVLKGLDPVTRAQLLSGNWLVRPAAGAYFKLGWFSIVDSAPAEAERVRWWDRAATVDGDWTVGLRMARAGNTFFIEHVARARGTPNEIESLIRQTADIDAADNVLQALPQDPGAAGKFEVDYYVAALAGKRVKRFKETGDKVTRAQPVSSQAEAGNIRVVRGPWNRALLDELVAFPEGKNDDQVDALSGAFSVLAAIGGGYSSFKGKGSTRR